MEETRNAPCSNGEEDRIGRLSGKLIHRIMSFIETKYAVQTSVLSKRWINIWKSLPFLNFHRSSFAQDKKHSFIMFVDMVFLFRGDFDIQWFRLNWKKSAYDASVTTHVNRWSLAAVKYNVEEVLIIISQLHNSAEIPHLLLNSKSLRKLEIEVFGNDRYADVILPGSMSLPQLKLLTFIGLSISSVELSKKLFSSCPDLETLHIVDCDIQTDNQTNLIVDSLSLKEFEYAHWRRRFLPQNDTMANIIKLRAPNLELFTCGSFPTQDYSLENCSPLSRVVVYMFLHEEVENVDAYSKLPSREKVVYAKRLMKFLGVV